MSSREIKGPNEETTRLSNLGDESGAGPGRGTPRPDEAPCPDPADNRRLPLPGSELDEYAIEAELGRGGMGVVYRAFDPRLRRHIALKLMHQEATAANLTRFRDEAQVTAQLQHPSVVPIYDIGQAESGEIYYTMRLVRGQTLAEVVSEHRTHLAGNDPEAPEGWTPFKLLQMFVTVCRSASYAHDRGVVHRDLKPSNVMIGAYGEVNVLDWGLAKFLGSSARDSWTGAHEPTPGEGLLRVGVVQAGPGHQKTQAGTIVGTPAFMAPEQAYGRSPDVSFSADVYSLGAILYYILTGTPPRHGTAAEVMEQLTRGTPPLQLRTAEPGISPDLDRLCMNALASEPSDRLESATLLADSVEGYLEGRALSTPRAQDAEFLRGYSSRHYRRPSVTVDVVLMTVPANGAARVALLCRDQPPFVGTWACPGTFVRLEEPLEGTAKRVLRDKVGDPNVLALDQIGAFGDPERDPRTRVITVAYLALVRTTFELPGDSSKLAWFDVGDAKKGLVLPATDTLRESGQGIELAFDHGSVLREALRVATQPRR